MSPPPKDKHVLLSAVYEVLVRALQETFPGAALLSVESGCSKCDTFKVAHTRITEHYGVLTVDYSEVQAWN